MVAHISEFYSLWHNPNDDNLSGERLSLCIFQSEKPNDWEFTSTAHYCMSLIQILFFGGLWMNQFCYSLVVGFLIGHFACVKDDLYERSKCGFAVARNRNRQANNNLTNTYLNTKWFCQCLNEMTTVIWTPHMHIYIWMRNTKEKNT